MRILLENTAGQGTLLGYRFEHLAWLIEHSQRPGAPGRLLRYGARLASGYEYRQPETYEAMWAEFDAVIGRARLHVVHLNDSLKDVGSHVDRHAQIGKGFVGWRPFADCSMTRRWLTCPCYWRSPKSDDLHEIIEDLATLAWAVGVTGVACHLGR